MADYTDPLVLQARRLSASTVSTLFSACVLLAVLHIKTHEKPDEVMGVGDPTAQTVISGCPTADIRMEEMDQDGQYEPLIEDILQSDYKMMAYRDTMPTASAHSGSDPTFTYTVVDGVVTAVVVSGGGTGFSGAAPTLLMIDALGSGGFGCELRATVSGGVVTAVTVVTGGIGYASSGGGILVNAGYSEGEKYKRPVYRWSEMQHVARIYDNDVKSAVYMSKNADKEGAVMSVTSDAFKRQIANQATEINRRLWTGAPSDQTASFWDDQFGLLAAIDDGGDASNIANYDGNYAGVDRTSNANYWYRSVVDTTTKTNWTLQDLVLDMNQTKGLAFKGNGPDIILCNPVVYNRWATDATNRTQEVNLGEHGSLRELGMYGFRKSALKFGDGTYAISDYHCPKATVLGINSKSIKVNFKSGEKFAPSKLYDQHGIPGGIEGSLFYVNTKFRFIIDAPMLNVKYTTFN